ncbi:hypothetical protein HK097_006564, partial [Rhizophlyctis rosea]
METDGNGDGSGGGDRGSKIYMNVMELPRVRLTSEDIAKPHPSAITTLYDALSLQCRQCGTRYKRSEEGKKRMDTHLDWHFRQNRRMKEKGKKAVSREWYLGLEEWVGEVVGSGRGGGDRAAPTVFFGNHATSGTGGNVKGEQGDGGKGGKEKEEEEVLNVPAEDEKEKECAVCHERLEKFYDEEREEWMLRGVVKIDGVFYHQTCHRDHDKASMRQKSPSPSAPTSSSTLPLPIPSIDTTPRSPLLGKRKLEEEPAQAGTITIPPGIPTTATTNASQPPQMQQQQEQQPQQQQTPDMSALMRIDPAVLQAFLASMGGVEGVKRVK